MDKSQTATNFGLARTLNIPVYIKIRSLTTPQTPTLASASDKFASASTFKTLSHVSANSSLFVRVQVYDGNHNAVSQEVQTPFREFSGNKRVWDSHVRLPVNYNQLDYSSYFHMAIYEVVEAVPVLFGSGTLSVFDHSDCTLRKGLCKVKIQHVNYHHGTRGDTIEQGGLIKGKDLEGKHSPNGSIGKDVDYGNQASLEGSHEGSPYANDGSEADGGLEQRIVQYENGHFHKVKWLDTQAFAAIQPPKQNATFLHIELPNFSLPIVYSDVTYRLPQLAPHTNTEAEERPETRVLTSIEIGQNAENSQITTAVAKIYDPDFACAEISAYNSSADHSTAEILDPIELKFQKLSSNININSNLDRELKPSPHMRDELWRILNRPSSAVLTDYEKKNLWKYRFYFSKNQADDSQKAVPSQTTKQFLTKFLKSLNWENESELDHVFAEILPYWSVDRIDIGDALELLSNNFNPHALLRHHTIAVNVKDVSPADDAKINKIFAYSRRLRHFAVQRLTLASADELLLYLLQLVQALKYENMKQPGPGPGAGAGSSPGAVTTHDVLEDAPLARFLIEKSVKSARLGNFFYWYVKVENEDQLMRSDLQEPSSRSIYNIVMNTYIDMLKKHCAQTNSPQYTHLKRQIAFVKKLTGLVELLRASFKKNEATSKKVTFLQEYLSDPANGMLKFSEPFPLPLDPDVMICGCYPAECSVFKSSLAPLKITFKTVANFGRKTSASIFGTRSKHGKYSLMFKIGDDLRQDQLVIQIINLMDQLLKNENLDLKLTPYKILATSPIAGFIQFVPNETLDSVLSKNLETNGTRENGILKYLQHNSKQQDDEPDALLSSTITANQTSHSSHANQGTKKVSDLGVSAWVMDNYVKSCAGYCVITYILGVGDRHLDNLLLSPNGKFWHADFGYILGRDPKPFPPLMKLPIQVIDGMGGMNHENFNLFKSYCFITYTTLRRNSNLILNLFQLMLNANIPDIQIDPKRAVEKVEEKFALDMTEEEAILHFQNLIIDSVNAFLPVVIDTLHSLAQYWRA